MHLIEQKILNQFKKEPLKETSTTEIVRAVHPEEYSKIIRSINSETADRKDKNNSMREKGQLHRKVLYHLNKLVDEKVLIVTNTKGKGEKMFSLNIEQGEIIVEKKRKTIIINKPSVSTNLIDEYEDKKIIQKFDPESWINKVNCILLENSQQLGTNKYYDVIYNSLSEVNDALGLNDFEQIIQDNPSEEVDEFINKLDIDTKDHNLFVSMILNTQNFRDEEKIKQFIRNFARKKPKNIALIFKTESKDVKLRTELFKEIIEQFSSKEIKINLQNSRIHSPPMIIGKAGSYTIEKDEWENYKENIRGKTIGLVISQVSIAIDLYRFFRESPSANDFRELIMRTAKTMLQVNSTQRRKSNDYFKKLNDLNYPNTKKFFLHSNNYIRFWNYNLSDEKQANLLELMQSAKKEIDIFCKTEETIYKSCGIPITFRINFSSVFKKFSPNLSSRIYHKTTIKRFKDFQSKEMSILISLKEDLTKIFDGGDRARFFRRGEYTAEEIIKEWAFLMNTHELQLITYDFKELKGDVKLTNFM